MSTHDDAMLEMAALHGLGLVPLGESEAINAHLRECKQCRQAYVEAAAVAAGLARSATMQPPAELRARILQQIRNSVPQPSQTRVIRFEQARPRRSWPLTGGVIAAIVIAVLAALGVFHRASMVPPQVASGIHVIKTWRLACATEGCAAHGDVEALSGNKLVLRALRLPKLASGRVYQAWLIQPGAKHPVPEPTFTSDVRGNGAVAFAGAHARGAIVAVTIEPAGGSRAPTTKPLLVATLD